ncbi:hypothetical protein Scep_027600 [Stephania cephalantha]|uniref:Uncharacterized protein n=1 Tax=Stephania cephalantha TaxID=152367 RepID=A0AAP0EBI1_9MAGN
MTERRLPARHAGACGGGRQHRPAEAKLAEESAGRDGVGRTTRREGSGGSRSGASWRGGAVEMRSSDGRRARAAAGGVADSSSRISKRDERRWLAARTARWQQLGDAGSRGARGGGGGAHNAAARREQRNRRRPAADPRRRRPAAADRQRRGGGAAGSRKIVADRSVERAARAAAGATAVVRQRRRRQAAPASGRRWREVTTAAAQ